MPSNSQQLAEILTHVKSLRAELKDVDSRLTRLEASAEKMDDHIGFVDGVYHMVKSPFHRLMQLLNNGNDRPALFLQPSEKKILNLK